MAAMTPRVAVVGDAMLDLVVHSRRFARTPEAGVPILPHPENAVLAAGGSANVAINLARLGCRPVLFAQIGSDDSGRTLTHLLESDVLVHQNPALGPTTTKTRYYENGHLIARHDRDRRCLLPSYPPMRIDDDRFDALILTDYGKGDVTAESVAEWVGWCRSRGIPVYGDPKIGRRTVWRDQPGITMVANRAEAIDLLETTEFNEDPTVKPEADRDLVSWLLEGSSHSQSVRDPIVFREIVVKRGPLGSIWGTVRPYAYGEAPPIDPRRVYDVQGAGDSYIAGLVAARCRGHGLSAACLFASAVAGVAVGKPGTATVTLAEAVGALADSGIAKPHGAISYIAALHVANDLRAWGFSIGLTNGCFDLTSPHPGQVATIQRAASECDFLFVAVDSDARVRSLKGRDRPRNAELDRSASMGALRGVGASFVFDTSMDQVVQDFRPAVLVKGAEYREKGVPESRYLDAWGGRMVFADMVRTPSTTERHR